MHPIVSCVTGFFYYCTLRKRSGRYYDTSKGNLNTFFEQKEYIWSKKWTAGKAMYLLTRYSGAAFMIFVNASIFKLGWNDVRPIVGLASDATPSTQWLCLRGYLYVGPGTFIILLAEIILQMRVYALYGRQKKVLILLILLTVISLVVAVLQPLGIANDALSLICVFGGCKTSRFIVLGSGASASYYCTDLSSRLTAIGWFVTSMVELILFIMVLMKTRHEKRNHGTLQTSSTLRGGERSHSQDIITAMARDSTSYFAIIFTICLAGTCLSFVTEIRNDFESDIYFLIDSLLNAYQTFAVATMTILAPNLLIRLRMECYGHADTKTNSAALTPMAWNVASHVSGPGGLGEEGEHGSTV
ncbi:hypothetical protein M0805_002071 [Coniferiporia weirii]|nr:hypothetical protein M0805_002071 [Coniferiporia weirii]